MIRIIRPINPPRVLIEKGPIENKKNCDSFSDDPVSFLKAFKADPKIYGGSQVKKMLKRAQHNKCCFCEKNQVDEYGAVEHFRPKSGYKIDKNQKKLTKPGYYWLAYEWTNLLFVCAACNMSISEIWGQGFRSMLGHCFRRILGHFPSTIIAD